MPYGRNKKQMTKPIFTALSDGTHIHHRNWGDQVCSQSHPKKLSNVIKIAILSGWFTASVLAVHLILRSNNL